MTDYAGEQEMEIQAMESILGDDWTVVDGPSPSGWPDSATCWRVPISAAEEHEEAGPTPGKGTDTEFLHSACCDLLLAHTASYPDEAPLVKISNVQGLSNQEVAALQSLIEEQIEANLGMAMLYTIVSAAQEWMRDKSCLAPGRLFLKPDAIASRAHEQAVDRQYLAQMKAGASSEPLIDPEEAKRRAVEAEEARLASQRAHGTMVTQETFAEWRHSFDKEQSAEAGLGEVLAGKDKGDRGPSGKQFFMSQEAAGRIEEEEDIDEGDATDYEDDTSANGPSGAVSIGAREDHQEESDEDDDVLDDFLATKGQ